MRDVRCGIGMPLVSACTLFYPRITLYLKISIKADIVSLQSSQCHRSAPPTYEEALNSRLADQHRIPTSSRARLHHHHHHHSGGHLTASVPGSVRSLSEERTLPTAGLAAAAASGTASTSSGGLRGRRAYMVRSSRAEEIPDIYWEQAARELDFCTCRKCQVRDELMKE